MRRGSGLLAVFMSVLWYCSLVLSSATAWAQNDVPAPDQLDQLLAPIALYPDALVAQICAASTDPQQILDADAWLKQNLNLSGQARTDAAQQQGFDAAFIALINFPQVLDMMARNIDSYAAIGRAFSADQAPVMDSIQRLRQQAYAAGNLESNQYQNVDVTDQGGVQAVTIVPANPQVVYVPVYNPQVIYATPDPGVVVASSLLTFGVGIALGAWIVDDSRPWGWGGWGWNWGRRTVIVHNNYWVVNNRYRPQRPYYHYRPPAYNRPIYVRPPNNWHDRPYYRPPPGGRPPGSGYPGGGRPPGGGSGGRPPGSGYPGGGRPPGGDSGARPPGSDYPGGGRPPGGGNPVTRPPGNGTPGGPGTRPPPTVAPQPRPSMRPSTPPERPAPPPVTQPATPNVNRPQPRPGYPSTTPSNTAGARPSAFGGSYNASADRAAESRGRSSLSSQQKQQPNSGGQRR